MPTMPLMPTSADQVASPMGSTEAMPPVPPSGGGGDLASLLSGGGPSAMGLDPVQAGMRQFDMVAQQIADLARMFPGSEQFAQQMMEALDAWMTNVLVMTAPPPASMPGADSMM